MVISIKNGALAVLLILTILFSGYHIFAANNYAKASSEIVNSQQNNAEIKLENDVNFENSLNSCKSTSGAQKNYIKPDNPLVTGQAILLMESKKSDLEKLKSAFEFVSNGISYKVYNGWRYPENVLDSKNGDCTDKSVLLVSMLKNEGIDSYVVYGKAVADYSHAWVAAKIGGKWLQVDPTAGDLNYFYECSTDTNCKYFENYKIAGMFNDRDVLKCGN